MTNHSINFRIYYEDTDALGIVYHANYLKFAERARTEWLRTLGFNQSKLMKEEGLGFVVTHIEIDFLSSAKIDDLIRVDTKILKSSKVRFTVVQWIKCDDIHLAKLTVDIACLNSAGKPQRIPENLSTHLLI